VRLQQYDQTWIGPRLHLNFMTKEMDGEDFRTGRGPYYAAGAGLHADVTNGTYSGTNMLATVDDYDPPLHTLHAKKMTIVPGHYFKAKNATVYVGPVPIFYVPYWYQDLSRSPNRFNFLPGYSSKFGPFLLSTYDWQFSKELDGAVHGDWREKRGFGVGPDLNYHLGQIGEGSAKYYYTHDDEPGLDPLTGAPLPSTRQRANFEYLSEPRPGLSIRSQAEWQTDPYITRDFFESEYRSNSQPATYLDLNQNWRNWSFDVLTVPRVNPFFETVERLPELKLSGFRQQIFDTPLYYESETSAGYYERLFSNTNLVTPNYEAARADTFHQITLPETFFGWLNVTPRAGGRFTYYEDASGPGATTTEQHRGVFETGAQISTKASRLWSEPQNHFFDVDGLRHIIEPMVDYMYVPKPNVLPSEVPQFDYEFTNSLRMLPLEFPEYNSIDSIDSENTVRLVLRNRLQTKRKGEVDDLVNWAVYTDWRLSPHTNQTHFSDFFSDLQLKPRSWLIFESLARYDLSHGDFNVALNRFTLKPNNTWSWGLGHFYVRDGTIFGTGSDLYMSTFFYRFNENWGVRLQHNFDAISGKLQEQDYSIYRDLRSWTAALTFRLLNSVSQGQEFSVGFTFSFKAFPRFGLGHDSVNAASLIGY
jgi:lipopolysaccharide assembly outer membrane protein LptD (OstA)